MAIFTAVRNKKQTAGTMMGVLKYVTQACKTMLDDQWMVTGHSQVSVRSIKGGHFVGNSILGGARGNLPT